LNVKVVGASRNQKVKVTAEVAEELNQSIENSDTEKKGIQRIKARLGELLKKKLENKVMHSQYI
jgi:hypothetical protein